MANPIDCVAAEYNKRPIIVDNKLLDTGEHCTVSFLRRDGTYASYTVTPERLDDVTARIIDISSNYSCKRKLNHERTMIGLKVFNLDY